MSCSGRNPKPADVQHPVRFYIKQELESPVSGLQSPVSRWWVWAESSRGHERLPRPYSATWEDGAAFTARELQTNYDKSR